MAGEKDGKGRTGRRRDELSRYLGLKEMWNEDGTVKLRSNKFEGTNYFHPLFPKLVIANI